MLWLVSNPSQLLNPAHTDTMPCEYRSIETQEKWNEYGVRLGHTLLSHEAGMEQGSQAHNASRTTGLYRDEVSYTRLRTDRR